MKFLTTIIVILPVLCVVAPASAALRTIQPSEVNATGRISVSPSVGVASASNIAAARRLPTLKVTGTTTTTTTTSSTSSLMEEVECVERYTECIKASDVCDFNFEECTTKELFYAKKPQCNSVLLQCTAAGINTLFGTSVTTNLSAKNDNGEYVYPTAGSVLGQFIEAGAISNRLDTSSCVKRYTSCLKKDNVCGEDFELCTTNSEFKKQKIYCESTLARCQEDGIKELFGLTDTTRDPTSQSRLGVMITEGQQLAALNSVSTCYKIADQCVLSACGANPYKCIANSDTLLADVVDAIKEGRQLTEEQMKAVASARTKADVSKYIKGLCYETIAGNKYCYATVLKSMPTNKQLLDEENRDEIYADIISSTMTRVDNQLQSTLDKFDKQTKDTCSDVITSCAMRSCGGGLGSACYSKVFGSTNICFTSSGGLATSSGQTTCSINASKTYNEIRLGCEAIVNTDANCQYAAASASQSGYNYSYADIDTFGIVFPEKSKGKDPIGVVARLNKALRENYSPAAIEKMAKECKTTAVSCIRSMCGADFKNCYRNRTDVMTDTYGKIDSDGNVGSGSTGGSMSGRVNTSTNSNTSTNTIDEKFAKSMNKVGGVLDFTIVRGLCVNVVKDSPKCEEHLKIQTVVNNTDDGVSGWGDNKSVRDAWVGAVSSGYNARKVDDSDVLIGCVASSATAPNGQECDTINPHDCDTVDDNGCVYDQEKYESINVYQLNMEVDTLFQEVMADLELEAQAKYNAKLTAEQHMCIDANSGGIMGKNDLSSTYMWVKLRNNRVPKNYSVNGLKANEFVASNELYGSFCRARVTIQSDDPDIQRFLQNNNNSKNWSTAYFAVGDVFTCGSWIPQKDLESIAYEVAKKKTGTDENGKLKIGQQWGVAGMSILGAVGGAAITDALQTNTGLGGLLSTNATKIDTCKAELDNERNYWANYKNACGVAGNKDKVLRGYKITSSGVSVIRKNSVSNSVVRHTLVPDNKGEDCVSKTQFDTNDGKCVHTVSCDQINNVWSELDKVSCGETRGGKRTLIDLAGAGVGGAASGITTAQIMKSTNRTKFTEAQQEFMDNVGEHIYCFIGADEAGTYGDLIEISVE